MPSAHNLSHGSMTVHYPVVAAHISLMLLESLMCRTSVGFGWDALRENPVLLEQAILHINSSDAILMIKREWYLREALQSEAVAVACLAAVDGAGYQVGSGPNHKSNLSF